MVMPVGPYFIGHTDAQGGRTVTYNGSPLPLRLDLRNHSPDGFNWGYGGSGPAQLALAILAAALGDDVVACELYQSYKWHLIASIGVDHWTLPVSEVIAWMEDQTDGRERLSRN